MDKIAFIAALGLLAAPLLAAGPAAAADDALSVAPVTASLPSNQGGSEHYQDYRSSPTLQVVAGDVMPATTGGQAMPEPYNALPHGVWFGHDVTSQTVVARSAHSGRVQLTEAQPRR